MAKIEKPSAVVENLEPIVSLCDGIMVARGDLGVEMNVEDVPVMQKRIIDVCHRLGKPVIVATQMLESMIEAPTPTRAEASDVATAIYDGADGVMLSAESAAGQYPVEAVTMQQRIISRVESDGFYRDRLSQQYNSAERTTTDAITAAARQVAETVGAKAIIVFTKSGTTVLRASKGRPGVPIVAITSQQETARWLSLAWGVLPAIFTYKDEPKSADFAAILRQSVEYAWKRGLVQDKNDLIVVTAGIPFGTPGAVNLLRVVSAAGPDSWSPELCNTLLEECDA